MKNSSRVTVNILFKAMKRFLKIAFSFTIVTLEFVTTVLYVDKRTTRIQKYAFYPAFVDYKLAYKINRRVLYCPINPSFSFLEIRSNLLMWLVTEYLSWRWGHNLTIYIPFTSCSRLPSSLTADQAFQKYCHAISCNRLRSANEIVCKRLLSRVN